MPVRRKDDAVREPLRAAFSADSGLVLIQDGGAGVAVCDKATGRRLAQVTGETGGSLTTLGVSSMGNGWWVSRMGGVTDVLSGPLRLTAPHPSGPGTWEMQALGRPGPFQVELSPSAAGKWVGAGSVRTGPRVEVPAPDGDPFWRLRTVDPE